MSPAQPLKPLASAACFSRLLSLAVPALPSASDVADNPRGGGQRTTAKLRFVARCQAYAGHQQRLNLRRIKLLGQPSRLLIRTPGRPSQRMSALCFTLFGECLRRMARHAPSLRSARRLPLILSWLWDRGRMPNSPPRHYRISATSAAASRLAPTSGVASDWEDGCKSVGNPGRPAHRNPRRLRC